MVVGSEIDTFTIKIGMKNNKITQNQLFNIGRCCGLQILQRRTQSYDLWFDNANVEQQLSRQTISEGLNPVYTHQLSTGIYQIRVNGKSKFHTTKLQIQK